MNEVNHERTERREREVAARVDQEHAAEMAKRTPAKKPPAKNPPILASLAFGLGGLRSVSIRASDVFELLERSEKLLDNDSSRKRQEQLSTRLAKVSREIEAILEEVMDLVDGFDLEAEVAAELAAEEGEKWTPGSTERG